MLVTRSLVVSLLFLVVHVGSACGQDQAQEAYLKGNEALEAFDYAAAITHYDRSLALNATNADAYLKRGQVYWMLLQHDRAVPDLTRALDLDPDLPWAYYFRGVSLMNLKDFEAGIDDLTKAAATQALPRDFHIRAVHFRAVGYMNLERYDDAITDITTCIDLNPEQRLYLYERAALYEAVDNPQSAATDYEAYLASDPPENEQTAAIRHKLALLRETLR